MSRAWLLLPLVLAGCAAPGAPPVLWEKPGRALVDVWRERSTATREVALLARTEFRESGRVQSFTLELFFRAPDTYMLRGRGTLGITGFRARIVRDSLIVLLDREARGFEGSVDSYPDDSTRALWQLLRAALPWLVGVTALSGDGTQEVDVVAEPGAGRPVEVRLVRNDCVLQLGYGRYREEFPFWHLQTASGRSPGAELHMEIRQQLYNSDLPPAVFELVLPPGTLPLTD